MHWKTVLEIAWAALNSPAGISVFAALVLYGLNKLYTKKPLWQQYEGAIISAVKFAEQEIPDDTPNKGLERLDTALRYVLKVYEEACGKAPSAAQKAQLKEGIQIVHAGLEANGGI